MTYHAREESCNIAIGHIRVLFGRAPQAAASLFPRLLAENPLALG